MTNADSAQALRMPLDRVEIPGRAACHQVQDPVVWTDRGIGCAEFTGDQDYKTIHALRLALSSAGLRAPRPLIVVVLDAVGFIDSGCLGAILGAHKRLRLQRGTLALTGLSPHIAEKLHVNGLDRVFPVLESLELALKYLDLYDPNTALPLP